MDFDEIIMNHNENSTFRQRGREHSAKIIALMKISITLCDIDNSLPPWSFTRKAVGRRWTRPKQHYHWEWWHQRLQRTESQRTDLPQFPPEKPFFFQKAFGDTDQSGHQLHWINFILRLYSCSRVCMPHYKEQCTIHVFHYIAYFVGMGCTG